MISSSCYSCGVRSHIPYAEENGFFLVKCTGCGLLFVSNPPAETETIAAHIQGKHRGDREFESTFRFDSSKLKRYDRALTDLLGDVPLRGDWLDVGCGHGEFMLAVKRRALESLKIRGSEPNLAKRLSAKGRGLDVDFLDLESLDADFDTVSLLNVYSHLPNPPEFLGKVKRRLRSGGELILETGDTADMPSSVHHRPLYLPDHLSFASEAIIRNLLTRLGFEVIKVSKFPLLQPTALWRIKQMVKMVVPGKTPDWHLTREEYSAVDMWIRARVI